MTTTTTARWRAQTDPSIKTWHLGTEELGARCVCGTKLIEPDDTRAFALKVPAEKRHYETSDDLERVTCGSCRKNRAFKNATGGAEGEVADAPPTAARPSRRKATGDPRADRAAVDRAAAADRAAVEPRRRPSRADRAHAKQEEDRARREAAAEAAG